MPSKKAEDDDPVVREYKVYVTQNLIERYFLLQFPTRARERPYNEEHMNSPCAVRLKPKTGFVELDVPMNPSINYDQHKAAIWADALAKNKQDVSDGYGMAVGFSQASRGQGGRKGPQGVPADDDDEKRLEQQTLGGQMMYDEQGKPNYMIGTFLSDKGELHLTTLDGVVQMRPQFHHIDAKTQADRARAKKDREAGEAPVPKSSIVQMSYTSIDQERSETASTKMLLQNAHEEQWKPLAYLDEEDTEAYQNFADHLFLQEPLQGTELVSSMNNDKYLDAISAPRLDHRGAPRTKPMTKKQKAQIELSDHEVSDVDQAGPG